MTDRVLKILEYDKIIEKLTELASSEMGKERAKMLRPANGHADVANLLQLTQEADDELTRLGRSPVDSFPDVRDALQRSGATLALGMGELLAVAKALRAMRFAKSSLTNEERSTGLYHMAISLHTARGIEEEIFRCILTEDEMADAASPKLASLRRSIRACNDRVRDKLNAMIHSPAYRNCLQESIITIRNGRYVLPVKQEHRLAIPGLLHDQSGSGATLFIEPMAVVEIGNELKKLLSEEAEEIQRILSELTAAIAPEAPALLESFELLAEIDVIFAKAKLGRDMRAVCPNLNTKGFMRIVGGRHPLIDPAVVVPIDLWLGKDFTTLIITGPNTGGKTVTLKTVGLFALMTQSGMFLPAMDGTEMPVFNNVFADIGDEQSIAQNLSTFSSHMKNVVDLLKEAEGGSLVLVDELGSGTDPVEGAALAMSILEELHSRKARTLATTHYSELKAFALTREGMENASVEFDVTTLRPTYRLFIGIPGKSNAFKISRKLGLPEHIIECAHKHLTVKDISFEDAISGAESQRRIAEQERRLAEEARAELYRLRDETEKEKKRIAEQRDKAIKKAKEEARAIVQRTKAESERIIRELKALNAAAEADRSRAIQKARDELRASESKLQDESAPRNEKSALFAAPAPKSVQPGDVVRVLSTDNDATVLTPPDSKGEITVQAGILKLAVKLADVRLIGKEKVKNRVTASVKRESTAASLEIDVRGMTVDEAILEVDRYIDSAFLSGLKEVYVIHGKGTGALRAGIQSFLKRHKHVSNFRLGQYGEGEAGVTVVSLK
ncbi:MAG: endonuclease MutS2 [Christensenellales bacterium]|jgi:DNA mismatch repair protein MutS2